MSEKSGAEGGDRDTKKPTIITDEWGNEIKVFENEWCAIGGSDHTVAGIQAYIKKENEERKKKLDSISGYRELDQAYEDIREYGLDVLNEGDEGQEIQLIELMSGISEELDRMEGEYDVLVH